MAKKTSKTTNDPSKFAKPYISSAANAVQDTYNQNAGTVQDIAQSVQSQLPGLASKAFGDNPLVTAAQGYSSDVLGGKYLTGNPYLDQQIANTNADVANSVNAAIGSRGLAGGSAQAQILARELAKNETALRYSDYNSERDRMGQAASSAPALASAEYAGVAPYLAAAAAAAELPFTASNNLASGIGGLLGQYQTQTKKNSLFDNALNLISAGSSAYKSFAGGA